MKNLLAIKAENLHIGDGTVLKDKVVIVDMDEKKILEVSNTVENIENIEEAKVVTPGFIDAHTHIGIFEAAKDPGGEDTNEMALETSEEVSALDGINPMEPGFEIALRSGVTSVMIAPGSANVFGGLLGMFSTRKEKIIDKKIIKYPAGIKMAMGENPKMTGMELKRYPTTRLGIAAIIRKKFHEAKQYLASKGTKEFKFNLGLEHISWILEGKVKPRVHAHRADDMLTIIRIFKEFNIRNFTFEHGMESYMIADILAEKEIPLIYGPAVGGPYKVELENEKPDTPYKLYKAGVRFAFMTDYPIAAADGLILLAIQAVRYGLPENIAIKALTGDAAIICDIADKKGFIKKNMDADILLFDGNPFEAKYSLPRKVIYK